MFTNLYRRKTCSFCHQEYVAAREMVSYDSFD